MGIKSITAWQMGKNLKKRPLCLLAMLPHKCSPKFNFYLKVCVILCAVLSCTPVYMVVIIIEMLLVLCK
jgi:hypothetical protein